MKQSERPSFKKWYAANRERIIKKAAARNKKLKEERRIYCREYYHKTKTPDKQRKRAQRQAQRYSDNPELYKKYARQYRERLRGEFIATYGGKCACCGEAEPAFLTLEHKNRDGYIHRQKYSTSSGILAELRRQGWPKDKYEILCFNCNRATHEQGICPHRRNTE